MATNDFKPFATGAGANVIDQADYLALAELSSGFTAGKASSEQVNKVLRQATVFSSVLAQFISNQLSADVLDNGDTATVLNNLIAALNANIAAGFLKKTNNLSEIAAAGPAAQSAAIASLGLGDGSALPVGVPIPWPTATAPTGWLKCNGASFTLTTYPKLALAYPTGVLPDLRGEFIRGFDDGRGMDSGRVILTSQSALAGTITGNIYTISMQPLAGGTPMLDQIILNGVQFNDNTASQTITVTPGDTRPKNVSFNYVVRAA